MQAPFRLFLFFIAVCMGAGCANITSPTGGKKDVRPPKLLRVEPGDSLRNTKVKRVELHFDEYIAVADVAKEVALSPMLQIDPMVTGMGKRVTVKMPDSLLEENTTYRLSFGSAIKDIHEGNAFAGYTYTFSTGSYFDSLQLHGSYVNAATGLADVEGVSIILYSASENDSAIVKKKPKYVAKADGAGNFTFKGLPLRPFRMYALKDLNANFMYDGGEELVAFTERTVTAGDTMPVMLRLFAEKPDSALAGKEDTKPGVGRMGKQRGNTAAEDGMTYSVGADTNVASRTYDITKPLVVTFSKTPAINAAKITLSYEKDGVEVTPAYTVKEDTAKKTVEVATEWLEDMVYTLRLAKGFAKDSAGVDVMPSKYVFRTRGDEDYGKINMHLPAKYMDKSKNYVLRVIGEQDTVYQKPVTDTVVKLKRLSAGKYTFSIIVDKNKNGKWDTGDLLAMLQPEEVIPNSSTLTLKANWENTVDFEEGGPAKKGGLRGNTKPK
ncbi:MAG: Ig-like domain-containing protein [Bacteroidota bacterium]